MKQSTQNAIVAVVLITALSAGVAENCSRPANVITHQTMPPKHFGFSEQGKAETYAEHLNSVGWQVTVTRTKTGYDVTGHD